MVVAVVVVVVVGGCWLVVVGCRCCCCCRCGRSGRSGVVGRRWLLFAFVVCPCFVPFLVVSCCRRCCWFSSLISEVAWVLQVAWPIVAGTCSTGLQC